jgi:hypothetical protein
VHSPQAHRSHQSKHNWYRTKLSLLVGNLLVGLLFLEERSEHCHVRKNHARVPSENDQQLQWLDGEISQGRVRE